MAFSKLFMPIVSSIIRQNLIPKIVWTTANDNGNKKKISVCLKIALLIVFSSVPIFLRILYFSLSSKLSDNSFKAKIADDAIRKIIPRYKPIYTFVI